MWKIIEKRHAFSCRTLCTFNVCLTVLKTDLMKREKNYNNLINIKHHLPMYCIFLLLTEMSEYLIFIAV